MTSKTKAILGVIAALLVGGLGNGVWEYILEPAFSGGASLGLSVATLGVEAFKDDIYVEIAKGFHEKHSVAVATSVALLTAYVITGGLFMLSRASKLLLERVERSTSEIGELEAELEDERQDEEREVGIDERRNNLRTRLATARAENASQEVRVRRLHWFTSSMFALSIALFAWTVVGIAKSRYINSAIAHFEQSLAIVSPHAEPHEIVLIRSRFAQVEKREDFLNVLEEIERIGTRGDLKVAAFEVW